MHFTAISSINVGSGHFHKDPEYRPHNGLIDTEYELQSATSTVRLEVAKEETVPHVGVLAAVL
jgi:hypothetical protein